MCYCLILLAFLAATFLVRQIIRILFSASGDGVQFSDGPAYKKEVYRAVPNSLKADFDRLDRLLSELERQTLHYSTVLSEQKESSLQGQGNSIWNSHKISSKWFWKTRYLISFQNLGFSLFLCPIPLWNHWRTFSNILFAILVYLPCFQNFKCFGPGCRDLLQKRNRRSVLFPRAGVGSRGDRIFITVSLCIMPPLRLQTA